MSKVTLFIIYYVIIAPLYATLCIYGMLCFGHLAGYAAAQMNTVSLVSPQMFFYLLVTLMSAFVTVALALSALFGLHRLSRTYDKAILAMVKPQRKTIKK